MATLESIESALLSLNVTMAEVLNRLPARNTPAPGVAPQPTADYSRFPEGPRVIEVAPNIRMNLVAPVNPAYEPPHSATIFGRDFDGNPANGYPVAHEPSNARAPNPTTGDPGQPPRDPVTGYPLFYGAGGVAYLMNADGGFLTLAALEAERAQRAEHNRRSQEEWAARGPR